jgi:hypothetical protein
MTYIFRRLAAAFLASMAFALPASATSFSPDYTDLWFNRDEAGWGVNLIQQGNTIFATLFVYGPDQTPRWYVASQLVGTSQSTFSGALYRTTGPYFGAAWTGGGPAVQVGSMSLSFNLNAPTTGTLTYSVDGVGVTKSIERQTWVANNLSGNYLGGLTALSTGCSNGNNAPILIFNQFVTSHTASNQVSIPVTFFTSNSATQTCTFNGIYTQAGKMGNVTGNWSCTTGNAGPFTISQIDVTIRGWTGRFSGNDQFCTYSGNFGGVRDVI